MTKGSVPGRCRDAGNPLLNPDPVRSSFPRRRCAVVAFREGAFREGDEDMREVFRITVLLVLGLLVWTEPVLACT